jgi:hypothetical protein
MNNGKSITTAEHVARIITTTVSCNSTEMKRQLENKRGLEYNIKMDLKTWMCIVDCIRLSLGKGGWLLLAKTIIYVREGDALGI